MSTQGALCGLVSTGVADFALTGIPEISFWKGAHRRHTNFFMETQEIPVSYRGNSSATVQINKSADLVYWITAVIDMPALRAAEDCTQVRLENDFAYAFFESITQKVGGQPFETARGDFWAIEDEVNKSDEHYMGDITGHAETVEQLIEWAAQGRRYYSTWRFYSMRNPGDAFPLVSLQFSNLEYQIQPRNINSLYTNVGSTSTAPPIRLDNGQPLTGADINYNLYVDYVFLEEDERLRFAQWPQEYLITELNYSGAQPVPGTGGSQKITTDFNHPVKQLFVVARLASNGSNANRYNFSGEYGVEPIEKLAVSINNCQLQTSLEGTWFRTVVPLHTNIRVPKKDIYIYSFCLDYSRKNPTGQLNYSRVDTPKVIATFAPTVSGQDYEVEVFGPAFNIIRFHGGSGGKLFA